MQETLDDAAAVDDALSLPDHIASRIRTMAIKGELSPGQRLSEVRLAGDLGVSRNTLREAFRLLTRERLVHHQPNRGVFVAVPTMAAILDIYRVRRMIEVPALARAWHRHEAVSTMRACVVSSQAARDRHDWQGVGSANMGFHSAIVALADSPRLNGFYRQVAAELRLAFGLLDDPEQLHEPFIAQNAAILAAIDRGDCEAAAGILAVYLDHSERTVLTAFARIEHGAGPAPGL
ncbi:GntR family transcriptional regulator [Paracoccus subflavus]|uniref:GntR family transcriptional regulator n=1 Tax=Paracoccus subflavus TaxID=2528244 RepID=A0A4Q9G352_9RHOB|nr:GntR family transcriptional regulator [Paracoccus subflavus]TBN42424.1 GntR family transcriptional regulator [Paracoccus subflavus]